MRFFQHFGEYLLFLKAVFTKPEKGKIFVKQIFIESNNIGVGSFAIISLISTFIGAVSTIHALPGIVDAVGKDLEVWMDGGIRSGQDVLKAWALGAKGTLIGRSFLYGLGAMGEAGVTKCLEIIHKELDITMAFTGHRDIQNVTKDILYPGTF